MPASRSLKTVQSQGVPMIVVTSAAGFSGQNVIRALDGRPIRKRIHVPGRVVNLVA